MRARASPSNADVYCFDVAALCNTDMVSTTAAWTAASRLWPDLIVGAPALYVKLMKQVLPAVEHPCESVILMRLVVDEGLIGG